jgi:galactokinase
MIETDTIDTLEHKIEKAFKKEFLEEPTVLVFSPGRINIIGEHTDYNEGFVLPASINLGIVVAIKPSSQNQCTVHAVDKNEYIYFKPEDNLKPIEKGGWKNYVLGIVIELKKRDIHLPYFDMVFGGNIPGGAGLSSSASLENAVIFALNSLFNLKLSKQEMVLISQSAEHNSVGVQCGIMDQYASMNGRENEAIFLDCKTNIATYVEINFTDYELVLINSNVKHNLSEDSYNDRRITCEKIIRLLGKKSLREVNISMLDEIKDVITDEEYQMCIYVIQENERVLKALKTLKSNDIEQLGKLLFESHEGLKTQYQISCEELDFLVDEAKKHPYVIGSRMMGGGFGGCTINLVQSGKSACFIETVSKEFTARFGKDCTPIEVKISDGTRTIN